MNNWISVKDRLPEEGKRVIGWGQRWIDVGEVMYGTADDYDPDHIIPDDQPNEVRWRWHRDGTLVHDQNVTHWMPLPDPPKE